MGDTYGTTSPQGTENTNTDNEKPNENGDHKSLVPTNGNIKHEEDNNDALDDSDPAPPIPPDGGYGWVIMFASFICNVIVDGVCFSFGIFFVEFLDYFRESKAKTSWVGSVLNGMYLTMGPIVGALANKFGCRAVTIAGSILATVAYILSTFSPNVDILILTYGALGGAGFGLMYLPAIVMVGFYFEKRRALATGIAVCGSGIGAFVFAPLCEKLLTIYSWQGATWIVAGLVLNGVVMGALFRPLDVHLAFKKNEANRKQRKIDSVAQCEKECEKVPLQATDANKVHSPASLEPKDLLHQKLKYNIDNVDSRTNGKLCNKDTECVRSLQNLCPDKTEDLQGGMRPNKSFSRSCDDIVQQNKIHHAHIEKDVTRPMYRKDIFYSGSVHHLPEFQSNQDVNAYVRSVTSIPDSTGEESCMGKFKSMTDTLRNMMDFSLLWNPVFCVYGMSCFLCMAGFFVPFIYLPDNAIDKGLTKSNAAFLLSIIGIANTIARVLCGWVSDQPWADCLLINNLALIMGGVATMLCPWCINFGLLATYSAVFGSGIAVFVSLRSIIMVELMGLDKLTNAFGLVTMCQGLSAFIGAPIAGALFDATGNYNLSFYVAGSTIALAGIICLPLRRISVWYKKRQAKMCQSYDMVLKVETPEA